MTTLKLTETAICLDSAPPPAGEGRVRNGHGRDGPRVTAWCVLASLALVGCGGAPSTPAVPATAPYAALFGDRRAWRFEVTVERDGVAAHAPLLCLAGVAVTTGRVQVVPLRCRTDLEGPAEWLDRELLVTELGLSTNVDAHGRTLLYDTTDLAPLVSADRVVLPPRPVAAQQVEHLPCCVSYRDQPALDVERRSVAFGQAWCFSQRVTSTLGAASEVLCLDARRGLVGGALSRRVEGSPSLAIHFGETPN